jgi:hypothetical protein
MADTKISALTALTGALSATDDEIVIVDTSAGETKRMTIAELNQALGEEGTWTPRITDGTNDDATYSIQFGSYTKIGNQVHVQGRVVITALGTISGAVRLTGLPFASDSTAQNYASLNISYAAGLNITAGQMISGHMPVGTTYVTLNLWDSTAGVTSLQSGEFSATGDIIFSMSYKTP